MTSNEINQAADSANAFRWPKMTPNEIDYFINWLRKHGFEINILRARSTDNFKKTVLKQYLSMRPKKFSKTKNQKIIL